MRKINIYKIIVGLLVLGMFSFSCENLDEEPFSFESASNSFESIANFESLMTGATRMSQQIGYYGLAASSKEAEAGPEFDTYSWTPLGGSFSSLWTQSYKEINSLNSVIDNIKLAQDGTKSQQDLISGKAYFFRAFTYFNLVRYFGDVPLNLSGAASLDQIGVDAPRTNSVEIYAQIISDFEKAENLLSTSALPGEPTSGAAKAYLAKVYLTMAGAPLKLTENYAKAASKAKEIMDSGDYILGEYVDNYISSKQNNSSSIIFQFIYSTDAGTEYSNGLFGLTSFRNGITNPGSRAWKRYMDDFPDGPRKEVSFYMNNDPVVSNFLNETDANGNYTNTSFRNVNYIGLPNERKYFLKESQEAGFIKKYTYGSEGPEGNYSDQNTVMFRYAEVLLIYAEAQNMAGGANELAYEALNSVRERGIGVGSGYPSMSLSDLEFDEAVITERYWEFGFEMKRWFDILRKEIPLTFDVYLGGDFTEFDSAFPNRYLFPIPQVEIELNPNLLPQNDGY